MRELNKNKNKHKNYDRNHCEVWEENKIKQNRIWMRIELKVVREKKKMEEIHSYTQDNNICSTVYQRKGLINFD